MKSRLPKIENLSMQTRKEGCGKEKGIPKHEKEKGMLKHFFPSIKSILSLFKEKEKERHGKEVKTINPPLQLRNFFVAKQTMPRVAIITTKHTTPIATPAATDN